MFKLPNKKGVTLMEMMVVVVVLLGMTAVAYPTYMSALEKGRAMEAVTLVGHLVAAQHKYKAENGAYATSFKALDVEISGQAKTTDATVVTDTKITTKGFTYQLWGSDISATSKSNKYAYKIIGYYNRDDLTCKTIDYTGRKICSSLGVKDASETSCGYECNYRIQ
ncbi:MAG: prepilin-type N-terminal cleavage/methylation domain-containing protein [Elusimicrobiota bacterium]|jgi:prepilin-type N-terminal cleavage/methylation domain-containing protein|nr:prepilin-type N-terminal cleavage/methylation domain-containing protein [Elusimicrobiota bacterium]